MNYDNVLTPPSSSNDGDSPVYFVASPTSTTFQSPDTIPSYKYTYSPTCNMLVPNGVHLKFIEEPSDRFRFRYKSEMAGTHGSLNGKTSDKTRKQTFPTVELVNYDKPAIIRCSIYQVNSSENDDKPHAHRLIKKHGREEIDDPHQILVSSEEGFRASFHSMGIIHTAKKNVVSELVKKKIFLKREEISRNEGKFRSLNQREEVELKRMAEEESKNINLNIVCLRFDAFKERKGILYPLCPPLFSGGINNLKSALTGELKIVRMDKCSSPTKGGREIFLLVERVTKKNIKVRFYELDENDDVVWEDYGKFTELDVHHQYAIVFRTPKYKDLYITEKVKVFIELVRPSDSSHSEPKEFTYTPSEEYYERGLKRTRCESDYSSENFSGESIGLPTTILEFPDPNQGVTSSDLNEAINNVDSDEFQRIFKDYREILNRNTLGTIENNFETLGFSPSSIQSLIANDGVEIKPNPKMDETSADNDIKELKNFQRTKPTSERFINCLNYYFGTKHRNNALHTYIKKGKTDEVIWILKLFTMYRQHHLVNITNSNNETPLHLAVKNNNAVIVKALLNSNADVIVMDSYCNYPLHVAVMYNCSIEIFEMLLCRDGIKASIDATNTDGDTALVLSIREGNVEVFKLLCINNANINLSHQGNGYTPLRFALQSENDEIIKYLLSLEHIKPLAEDFSGVNVLEATIRNSDIASEVKEVVCDYMIKHDIKMEIKEEPNADYEMKEEPQSMEELYEKVTAIEPKCLDQISEILDASGNWEYLADLLELSHYISSKIISSEGSISKNLLEYALQFNNETVYQIRVHLENLDEMQCVAILDSMAKNLK